MLTNDILFQAFASFQIESPESPETLQSFTLRKPSKTESQSVGFSIQSKEQQIEEISTDINIRKKIKPRLQSEESAFIRIDDRKLSFEEESASTSITLPSRATETVSGNITLSTTSGA